MYDLLLKNGKIIDGSGNPWFRGEVGILNGKIKNIGQISGDSTCTLDINNLVVCPGFIDIHSHSDISVLVNPKAESKIMQGVTTEVIGNCGLSPAPMRAEIKEHLKRQFLPSEFEWNWPNYSDFLETHEKNPSSLNIAPLIGHGALRAAVLGLENRAPTKEESLRMQKLLNECLDAGVFGLSTGLVYSPACFANTDEIIELARLLKKVNRLYTTHIRGEGANLIRAVEEALQIGREAEIPVQLSHHKAAGLDNWGKVRETLDLIEDARQSGIDATCDVYPYSASSTQLDICLPPWVREGGTEKMLERIKDEATRAHVRREMQSNKMQGFWASPLKAIGWERIVIAAANHQQNSGIEGMDIAAISESRRKDPFDVFIDILISEKGGVSCIYHEMCEEDVKTVMCHATAMIGSDGIALSPKGVLGKHKPHPRSYGTFPRVLGKYVRVEKLLELEQAIKKMTSFPAQKLGLRDRGMVREGFCADLVVFDPLEIMDAATFEEPAQFPRGIKHVIVNGVVVASEGRHTGATPGKLLRAN